MAQCHAERRKHPSAMGFYVGTLHSKLHSSSTNVDKYPHWPASAVCDNSTPLSTGYSRSSQSFRQEQASRPSTYSASFRESTAATSNLSVEAKPLRSVSHGSASHAAPYKKMVEAKLVNQSNGASAVKEMKPTSAKISSVMNTRVEKGDSFVCARGNGGYPAQPPAKNVKPLNADPILLSGTGMAPNAAPAGGQAAEKSFVDSNGKNACAKKPVRSDQMNSFPRIYKSAELGVSADNKGASRTGCVDVGSRLYKSGEQVVLKGLSSNVGKLNGGLYVGSQRQVAVGSGDSSPFSTIREGEKSSFGASSGSADLSSPIGGNLAAKDSSRRASSSISDGGSPMAKEVLKRSSLGGYGVADSFSSGISNVFVKDTGRSLSAGKVANGKDGLSVMGMGNILAGSVKLSNNIKAGCNGHSSQKPEDLVPSNSNANGRGLLPGNAGVDGASSRSLGNLYTGNWSTGNLSSTGVASKACSKAAGADSRSVCASTNPEDLKISGNEQYRLGHFSEAVALYDKAIGLCPNHAPYRSNRAAALTGLGRLGEAVLECEEAIKLDPQYSRAHQRAGHLYLRLGLIESARRHLQAAGLQDDAQDVQSLQMIQRHISRCIEARKAGDWRTVLQESNAAVAAGAESAPQVLGYKSEALLKLHRLQEAEDICAIAQRHEDSLHALGVAPADASLYMLQVLIEMAFGRFENAVGAAEAAVKRDPRNLETVALLKKARAVDHTRTQGNALFKAGRFFEACAVYGEGLESDCTNAVLLCNRAACRSKLGQWEKAIEDCDAALSVQPHYIKALMRRAHCSTKLERWEDALRDYEGLRIEMPNDMEVAQGYFDAQVALKKLRGEIHKVKFGGEVEEVMNEERFKEVTNLPGLAMVQFVTRWNNRCCQISPFLDELRKRFPCAHFVKVDIEDNPCIAKTESVTFVPTFKIYKSGQKVKELLGPSEEALEYAVKHHSL